MPAELPALLHFPVSSGLQGQLPGPILMTVWSSLRAGAGGCQQAQAPKTEAGGGQWGGGRPPRMARGSGPGLWFLFALPSTTRIPEASRC